jgi:hypothetical protein
MKLKTSKHLFVSEKLVFILLKVLLKYVNAYKLT